MPHAKCPTDSSHKNFITTAHVMQEWLVYEDGVFLDELSPCLEITHEPDPLNNWTCADCGAEAEVSS